MMRVGMVGCGHIGTVHAYALQQLTEAGLVDAALTATFDVDAERAARLARHHGGTPAGSLEELLDAVDVVWVCTWTAGHLGVVDAAVQRGLPVFCEKPLARTLAECEQVAAALRRVPHQVGLVLRWSPVFATAAAVVRDRRYGAVLGATLRDDQYFPIQGMYASTWRGEVALAGGGTLLEHSIHDVDVLRWILGEPEDVSARVATRFGHPGIDDAVSVTFGYPDGVAATLVSIWHQVTTRESSRRLEIFCEEALLWADDDYLGPLHVHTAAGDEVLDASVPDWADRLTVPEVFAKAVAHYAEPTKAFLDGLGSVPPAGGRPDVEEALAAHQLVDLAYRSAAAGGVPQRVPPTAPSD